MLGARVLHNFGKLAQEGAESASRERVKRVDEEEAMEGGLKGRFSAGAEVYFSATEKSGGGMPFVSSLSSASLTNIGAHLSVDRYPLYDSPRCNATFFPGAFIII